MYASISEQDEGESGAKEGGGFPAVSVNLVAAHAAAGHGEKALEAFHPEDVRRRGHWPYPPPPARGRLTFCF